MNDAMAQVKKELGRDAVVLHTKRIRTGGVMGFFGKEMVEVLAAVDTSANGNPAPNLPKKAAPPPTSEQLLAAYLAPEKTETQTAEIKEMPFEQALALEEQKEEQQETTQEIQPELLLPEKEATEPFFAAQDKIEAIMPPPLKPETETVYQPVHNTVETITSPEDTARFNSLTSEISSMKKMMEQLVELNLSPDKVDYFKNASPLFKLLLKNEVDPEVAAELVKGIPSAQASRGIESGTVKQVITERIVQYLKNIEGINVARNSCKKVALIGPTGVGKTTTIAKLAANFTIKQGYKVALITADTYRIAAIEQLRIYADIIGIPIEIVYSPEELSKAFHRHSDKDLILVDNAGRSPRKAEQLAELKALLAVDADIETHLVLSATIRYREALEAANKFAVCSPDKILFTKIDESCTLGTLLNILYYFPSTISYVTTGQSVPEDIELADANKLASLMLKDF
jgi:flagellar biosynthesis protein FlhF